MSLVAPALDHLQLPACCDCCEQKVPTAFCGECQNSKYCPSCDADIHSLKNKCSHKRTAIGEKAKSSGGAPSRTYYCTSHAERHADQFCVDCSQLVCALCRDFGPHARHVVRHAEEAAVDLRLSLQRDASSAAAALQTLTALAQRSEAAAKAIESSERARGREHISQSFAALEAAARSRQAALKKAVDDSQSHRRRALEEQRDQLRSLIEYGADSCERGALLSSSPALDLASGFKSCSGALEAILSRQALGADPVCDAAVPFSADIGEVETGASTYGVVGGVHSISLDLRPDGSATLRWRTASSGWTPALYRARLEVVDLLVPGHTRRLIGYERSVTDAFRAPSFAPSTECAVDLVVGDLSGCKVLFSVQGFDGPRVTDWVAAGGAVSMPSAFIRRQLVSSGKPFDNQGLFYHIGTAEHTRPFQNPAETGDIVVLLSSLGAGSAPASVYASPTPNPGESVFTANEQNPCLLVDIGSARRLRPTAYCLRHDVQGPRGVLRSWVLQGNAEDTDEDDWVTLSVHENDTTLTAEAGSVAVFKVSSAGPQGYRYFRIVQTGPNSSGKGRLMCCGLELYGDLY